jgi:hypothetical protein
VSCRPEMLNKTGYWNLLVGPLLFFLLTRLQPPHSAHPPRACTCRWPDPAPSSPAPQAAASRSMPAPPPPRYRSPPAPLRTSWIPPRCRLTDLGGRLHGCTTAYRALWGRPTDDNPIVYRIRQNLKESIGSIKVNERLTEI